MFQSFKEKSSVVCAAILLAAGLLLLPLSPALAQAEQQTVKFELKADPADPALIDVNLSFNMKSGQQALLKPSGMQPEGATYGSAPVIEVSPSTNPEVVVEPVQGAGSSWLVTSSRDGVAEVSYKVMLLPAGARGQKGEGEAPGGAVPPRAIADTDLKAFMASDALLAPENQSGGYITESYSVKVTTADGEKVLAPWSRGSSGSYSVGSTKELFSNYLAWGRMRPVTMRSAKPSITVGFGPQYAQAKDKSLQAYGNNVLKIYDEMVRVLGVRPEQTAVTMLVTGSSEYDTGGAAASSLRDSFILFHGGSELEGSAAAAAARGFMELWNRWSLVPSAKGGAQWLQEGLPWFWGYRVAGELSLMDASAAYEEFTEVYAEYVSDPDSGETSLADASRAGGPLSLLQTKGATLASVISVKIAWEGKGGASDFEWLLSQLAAKFDHFEGKEYSQADVSEILETGTSTSWDEFFNKYTGTTDRILASQFSTTDVFGSGGSVGGGSEDPAEEGSSNNWVYLVVAMLVILSIPVIFSTYIKRSVRLDMSMPKILPDDDEDEDGS